MYKTPELGLEVWDTEKDDFDHSQLSSNWAAIDSHSHTPGRGVRIVTAAIESENITTPLIKNESVTNPKLAKKAVNTEQLEKSAVTNEILANESVSTEKIINEAITSAKIISTFLPLGSVIAWYRLPGDVKEPGGGWEICDGRPWSEITNSLGYKTGNIPNIKERMIYGAAINGVGAPAIGEVGGTNSHSFAHSHTVNNHTHEVGPHNHGIVYDGNHTHGFLGDDGLYHPAYEQLARAPEAGKETRRAMFVPQISLEKNKEPIIQQEAPIDYTGNHNHTGATTMSGEFATGGSTPGTNSQLGEVDMRSAWVALLWIMRVR